MSMNNRQLSAAFALLRWAIGLSALVGLLWLGSIAPAYLAATFAFYLPPAWVTAASSPPARLLGDAAACGWLLWKSAGECPARANAATAATARLS